MAGSNFGVIVSEIALVGSPWVADPTAPLLRKSVRDVGTLCWAWTPRTFRSAPGELAGDPQDCGGARSGAVGAEQSAMAPTCSWYWPM